jgi:glucose dehydrogenase
VLVHPDRNGYIYLIDRATGELLSGSHFDADRDVLVFSNQRRELTEDMDYIETRDEGRSLQKDRDH